MSVTPSSALAVKGSGNLKPASSSGPKSASCRVMTARPVWALISVDVGMLSTYPPNSRSANGSVAFTHHQAATRLVFARKFSGVLRLTREELLTKKAPDSESETDSWSESPGSSRLRLLRALRNETFPRIPGS